MYVEEVIQAVKSLCQKHSAKKVILFGSRSKGTARERSDIDIAVAGAENFNLLLEEIENLPTLYTVDVVNLDTCRNTLLMEDIRQYGQKFMNRYETFQKSLDALSEAKERDMNDSFVLSGTSAKFSIAFDLSWKVMKDFLIQHYAVTDFVAGSPREVLRKAFETEMISDDVWMEMLDVRNRLIHDYDGEIIKQYCRRIVDIYIDKFYEYRKVAEKLLEAALFLEVDP